MLVYFYIFQEAQINDFLRLSGTLSQGPQKFSMDHFRGAFYIFGVGVLMATLAFLVATLIELCIGPIDKEGNIENGTPWKGAHLSN